MNATPRPWSADHLWHRDTGAPIQYAHIKADKQVIASAVNHDDADLIVTAVNEHDALVAKVAEVRAVAKQYADASASLGGAINAGMLEILALIDREATQ